MLGLFAAAVIYVCGLPGQPACQVNTTPADRTYVAPDGRTFDQLVGAHVLPDPGTTPGVMNAAVTPQTMAATVCRPGWTETVRPSTAYTDKVRADMTPAGFSPEAGELDHGPSIEDGGFPGPPPIYKAKQIPPEMDALFRKTAWWMIYDDHYGARVKDVLETKVKRLLCAGKITAQQASDALMPNWLIGYVKYVGPLPK